MKSDGPDLFPGYTAVEQLRETYHSCVYKARKTDSDRSVIIKVLKLKSPSSLDHARIKHDFERFQGLSIKGVAVPFDFFLHEHNTALVRDDVKGQSLKTSLERELSLDRFLGLAIRISEILGAMHQKNVFHRSIKPQNILLNPDTGTLTITDIGIEPIATRLYDDINHPDMIDGVLPYLSPEQTGRTLCQVDYRTDLYSLGATFYEMMTGTVPFASQNPHEIIHGHMVNTPEPPASVSSGIPGPVSDIIMKLLSKSPSDRYQSCEGLACDLKECLRLLNRAGTLTAFPLATRDVSVSFHLPQAFVGRDKELELFNDAFNRACKGESLGVLVAGEPGVGKTSLIQEFHKSILLRRCYFISGKCDQQRRTLPYSAIIQAIHSLLRQLQGEGDAPLESWRKKILGAVGDNGKIITDMIPEFENIIGPQPDIPGLNPEETQNRFNHFFKQFIRLFANRDHPLVVFIDDLQWADYASHRLIQSMAMDTDLSHILFIGTFRDREVSVNHPIMLNRDALIDMGRMVHMIHLAPLTPYDLSRMLGPFLSNDPELSSTQAQIVYDKTKGSPFFIHQFLKLLHDRNFLSLSPDGRWVWDLDGARSLEASENVVSLMADTLKDLSDAPRSTICLCACLGNTFDLDMVSAAADRTMDDTVAIINDLMDQGLIIQGDREYKFYHDRIQEAAYSLLPRPDREKNHYTIGRLLLEQTPEEALMGRIFEICDQLNLAGDCLKSSRERRHLVQLNLKAGIKAKNATAYSAAVSYLDHGRHLLSADAWESGYDLTFPLFCELMECLYLNHDFDNSEQLFSLIIANARSSVDKARAYKVMITLYTLRKRPQDAIKLGIEALKIFDIHLDTQVKPRAISNQLTRVKRLIRKTGLTRIQDLPTLTDKEIIAVQDLLAGIGFPSFYVNPNLLALSTLIGMTYLLKHGLTPRSGVTMIVAANIIQAVSGDYNLSYQLGEIALKINERHKDRSNEAMTLHTFAYFLVLWRQHVSTELAIYPKVYTYAMNTGNFIFAGNAIAAEVECRTRLDQPLEDVLHWLESHRDFIVNINDANIQSMYHLNRAWIRTLLGQVPMDHDLSDSEFDFQNHLDQALREKQSFKVFLCYYNLIQLKIRQKNWAGARDIALAMNPYMNTPTGSYQTAKASFLSGLALIIHAKKHGWSTGDKARVKKVRAKLITWTRLCPDNFKHMLDLMDAEMNRLKGRVEKSIRLYHESINGAVKNRFLSDASLACERLSDDYRSLGLTEEAREFLRRAHDIYVTWGARGLAMNLRKRHPDVSFLSDKSQLEKTFNVSTSSNGLISNLDLSTVMKVSRLISGEIMLERVLSKAMELCVTNAGAERGCLVFDSDKGLVVQTSIETRNETELILEAQPLENFDDASTAIVTHVHDTKESLILNEAATEGLFTHDPHVLSKGCRSILCMPVMNKGRLACVLYMENSLAGNVFTRERLEILKVITTQAAISLQNARLYEKISSEIDERKQAEEALTASETKYRSILEEMLDAYCETDLHGNITFINPSACAVTGYTPGELIGSPIQNLVRLSEQNTLESYYQEIFKTKEPGKPLACQLMGKDGSPVPLEIVTTLIHDKEGSIKGFRNVGRDVSERMRLEQDLLESSLNVHSARTATIMGLAKLAEYRDEDTGTHLERIREYARVLTVELSENPEYKNYISNDYIQDIYLSAILHDIGKVGVPDSILLKPGKLTKEEFDIIKTHTTLGGDAIKAIETKIEGQTFLTLGKEIAYFHHEKWDGSGYPMGLKGKDIPLSARIVALADVYDALTSKRVYKEAFSHRKSVDIIVNERGTHFDPDVVDAFLKHLEDFRRIREEMFDEWCGELRAV